MGERSYGSTYASGGTSVERVKLFITAYQDAPADADIEIRLAHDEAEAVFVVVSLVGASHAFTPDEARVVANSFEDTLRTFPDATETRGFPDVIMGLRACADRAAATPSPPDITRD